MRFGIMDMQLDALIPPGLAPQNALAHLAGWDHSAHVRHLADEGYKTIELGGDLVLFFPQSFSEPTVEALRRLRDEYALTYTVHLPLWSLEPSTPLKPVREGSVKAAADIIKATLPLEPEVYVLHSTGALAAEFYHMALPESARVLLMHMFQQNAGQSIQAILQSTGIPSRRLAIETIEFPFELTLELAEMLDVSVCLDTGHVLAGFSGPIGLFDALERVLPRLAEVHLHDAPWQGPEQVLGYGKDHRPLGAGDLDTGRLLDRLEEAGFTGPLIMELMVDEARASLEAVRKLRPGLVIS